MRTSEINVDTARERIVDLTAELERFCAGLGDGLANVFVPHATAGVALMETGSGSDGDLLQALERLLPAMTGTATLTVPPATEPITCSPPSSARR